MKINSIGIPVLASLFIASGVLADAVALFPFETVNTPPATVQAIAMTIQQQLEARGFTVIFTADHPGTAMTPPTVDAAGNQPMPNTETTGSGGPSDDAQAPSAPTGVQPTEVAAGSKSLAALGAGCRFYITGSLVQLGPQVTVTMDLFLADGARIAGKKIIAPDERSLPGAIQTISFSVSDEMLRYREPTAKVETTETAPPKPTTSESGFQKNFGLMLGQTFSLSDDMYSYISFYFNGRFEFNRLMMTTNAGFAIGNKDPENGFHFALNLSLSAYLLKTQVTPYLGGGFGFFIGNRMDEQCDYDDYYDYEVCDDQGIVGWDVFPVVGLEILRTMFMRVHLEGRYLVTFNGYGSWGHGPEIMMGIAF